MQALSLFSLDLQVAAGWLQSSAEVQNDQVTLCRHASDVHTFLVIDRSSSMASQSIRPDSPHIRLHPHFQRGRLDNVLGAVYEAAHKYILERAARAPRDVVTFIPFNAHSHVEFCGWGVKEPAQLLDRIMKTRPRGGTNFAQALQIMQGAVAQVCTTVFESHCVLACGMSAV